MWHPVAVRSLKTTIIVLLAVAATGCASTSAATPGGPNPGSAAAGTTTCVYQASGTASRAATLPPTADVPATGTVSYKIELDGHPIGLTLDRSAAPCTVNSFTSLAAQGFYDDTRCHRLGDVPGFQMLQCGDPTGTGSGGPGYRFADELRGSETYPAGTLAMANAGPNTNGSQFFLVFGDTRLDPNYTVFGTIDADGIAALRKIAAAGSDNAEGSGAGHPKAPARISAVTPR